MYKKKIFISLLGALGFILLSLPYSYSFSDKILNYYSIRTSFDNCPGLPTTNGIIIHSIIFFIGLYCILIFKDKTVTKPRTIKIEKFDQLNE